MPAHQRVSRRRSRPDRPASPAPHRPATCLIGCSGWQYKHWRGDFYPASLPWSRWLAHYAGQFNTVEVNNGAYAYFNNDAGGHAPRDAALRDMIEARMALST